jgi:hypothetical protein
VVDTQSSSERSLNVSELPSGKKMDSRTVKAITLMTIEAVACPSCVLYDSPLCGSVAGKCWVVRAAAAAAAGRSNPSPKKAGSVMTEVGPP